MIDSGFTSCGEDYIENADYCTYDSMTWTFADGIDEDVGKKLTLDYVWVKPLREGEYLGQTIRIEDCRVVGKNFKESTHRGREIKVFPSDHYGVFVELSW